MGLGLVSLSEISENKMQNSSINDARHVRYEVSFLF